MDKGERDLSMRIAEKEKCKKLTILFLVVLTAAVMGWGFPKSVSAGINYIDPSREERVSPENETFEIDENIDTVNSGAAELSPEEVKWPDIETDILEGKDVVNIMLVGQDRREGQQRQRSDTMILATINKEKNSLQLISFMRDLYVQIPGYSDNRMNAAYQMGGMELLDEVMETNFGIQIDGNVEVDFDGFQTLIDLMGGIELELTQEEADYICGRNQNVLYPQPLREDWNLTEGVNTLTGEQALIHARNRSVGNNDYRRTERQRDVLTAALDKAMNSDMGTMLELVDEGFSMLSTDMSHGEILGYALNVLTMKSPDVESYRIPQDGAFTSAVIRQMQVLVPDLTKCREYLQSIM